MKWRNVVGIIVFAAMLLPNYVLGDTVTEEWVKRYGNGSASDLAVDSSGNVYVTGSGATIKYDTNGNELWAKRYNVGATGEYSFNGGYPTDLAIDSSGNVYIAGYGIFSGPGAYIVLKYDTKPLMG